MNASRRIWRLSVAGAALATALVVSAGTAAAQSASAPAMKAAFLYNFAKFAQWPADALAPGQDVTLCVVDDAAVADALRSIIKGQLIDGHELALQVRTADDPLRSCHILFLGGLDSMRTARLLGLLKGASVFSVGDSERFVESGGVARLFTENDRMRFAINPVAARRARIMLSSKLLSLARIVKDEPNVPH